MRDFALPGRSPVYATNGLAATSHPLATTTAIQVLRDGGNAVDAAVAASATLCVVEPYMTGIGGDCFAIVAEPDGSIHGLNGSGRSPAAADLDRLIADNTVLDENSVHSVTVPGAVKAWEALHARFGAMDFARLFADAIRYGEEGFAISPRVARDWLAHHARLRDNSPGGRQFLTREGDTPIVGSMFALPGLAATLRKIAHNGSADFYTGRLAEEMVAAVGTAGGVLSMDDMGAVSADWIDTISVDYGGVTIHEIPPNGQGLTALVLLDLLARTRPDAAEDEAQRLHRLIECGRLAYAVRDAYVSDPQAATATVEQVLSDDHIAELAGHFDPALRNEAIRLPTPPAADTIYLTVVDRDLRAVSFINSLYTGFGSAIVTEDSAIALQSRGACFNLKPGHPNAYGPAKRPLHTIIPAMATVDGRPRWSFGVMGGAYQPMGHAHVLANMVDRGMDEQEALDDARIFWREDGVVEAETGIAEATREQLRARGHQVVGGGLHGGGQIIGIDHETSVLAGGSDPRKDGHAAGY